MQAEEREYTVIEKYQILRDSGDEYTRSNGLKNTRKNLLPTYLICNLTLYFTIFLLFLVR